MRSNLWRICGSGVAVLIAVGLYLPIAGSQEPKIDGVVIVAKEGKGNCAIEKGKEVVLKLAGQAGTGFIWRVSKIDDKALEPVGKPTTEKAKDAKVAGGPLLYVFRFKGLRPGPAVVELEYLRPFEKNVKPARTFTLTVNVVDTK
jgi:inhibitor of cysteine peptidase